MKWKEDLEELAALQVCDLSHPPLLCSPSLRFALYVIYIVFEGMDSDEEDHNEGANAHMAMFLAPHSGRH